MTGSDANGTPFSETTNPSGYVTITGAAGNWSFSVSDAGYPTTSWPQPITSTETLQPYLVNNSQTQGVEYGVDYRDSGATATTGVNVSGITTAQKQFVGEYLGTAGDDGYLRPADVVALQGLQIVSLYERSPTSTAYFTTANADADASGAIAAAIEAGQPCGSAIYFTIDYDPGTNSTALSAIDSYFREIRTYFNAYFSAHPGVDYEIGVYGPGARCRR